MIEAVQKEVLDYEDILNDNFYNLEKAQMALEELLGSYEWDYTPTAQKAMEYGSAIGKEMEKCSDEAKRSWNYLNDYKRIMWLISVARDYCYLALEKCESALEYGCAVCE